MKILLNIFLILILSLPLLAQENTWQDYLVNKKPSGFKYFESEDTKMFITNQTFEELKAKKIDKKTFLMATISQNKGIPMDMIDLYFYSKGEYILVKNFTFTKDNKAPIVIEIDYENITPQFYYEITKKLEALPLFATGIIKKSRFDKGNILLDVTASDGKSYKHEVTKEDANNLRDLSVFYRKHFKSSPDPEKKDSATKGSGGRRFEKPFIYEIDKSR